MVDFFIGLDSCAPGDWLLGYLLVRKQRGPRFQLLEPAEEVRWRSDARPSLPLSGQVTFPKRTHSAIQFRSQRKGHLVAQNWTPDSKRIICPNHRMQRRAATRTRSRSGACWSTSPPTALQRSFRTFPFTCASSASFTWRMSTGWPSRAASPWTNSSLITSPLHSVVPVPKHNRSGGRVVEVVDLERTMDELVLLSSPLRRVDGCSERSRNRDVVCLEGSLSQHT
jgi:hypothetical protein